MPGSAPAARPRLDFPLPEELLERLGIAFQTAAPLTDESALFRAQKPADTALRLAQLKAQSVRAAHRDALIIGSDQVRGRARSTSRELSPGNRF